MRKMSWLVIALAVAALQVQAQGPGMGPGGPPPGPMHGGFGPFGMGMHGSKTVTGAPYSAEVNNSMVQTLADGNTITHSTTGHVARDSQGRTYFQVTMTGGPLGEKGPKTLTFLSDPVAGLSYVLDAEKKTAIKRPLRTRDASNAPEPGAKGEGRLGQSSADRVETDLGQQPMNGVTAQGKSITHTIPAGAMGNAQPIVEKSEIWTAPDLQVVVLARHSDPRMGQSTYTLNNIQRGEPNASLFQVPSDYTVEDGPAFGHGGPGRRGPQ